jgi:hypothetical protein
MIDSEDWFPQTFHRRKKGRKGRSKYEKGHRHHTTDPSSMENGSDVAVDLPMPPKNTIIADKMREIGLLK